MDNKKQILSVLPSLFEEFIDISNLKFFVHKIEKNRYLSFAYDENKIIEALEKMQISLSDIKRIYFAQMEFLPFFDSSNTNNLKFENTHLSLIDEIVVKIPEAMAFNLSDVKIVDEIKLSNNYITLSSSSRYIDNKTANIVSIFAVLFSLVFLTKMTMNNFIIDDYQEKIKIIKAEEINSLSTIQIKSIIQKYDKTYNKQVLLRNILSNVLVIKDQLNIDILSINIDRENVKFIMKENKKDFNIKRKIEQRLGKSSLKYNLKIENNIVMEFKL